MVEPGTVILKVESISVKTRSYEKALVLTPTFDVLYRVDVPKDMYEVDEEGTVTFNVNGMRHIIRKSFVALLLEADSMDDF